MAAKAAVSGLHNNAMLVVATGQHLVVVVVLLATL